MRPNGEEKSPRFRGAGPDGSRPLSVLLMGCGHAGMAYEWDPLRPKPASFLGGLQAQEGRLRLAGICDPNPQALARAHEHLGEELPSFTDPGEALLRLRPEVVGLATWTATHVPLMNLCLDHQVRGLVVEKPLTTSWKEARQIDRRLRACPVPVEVNHLRRWDRRYLWAREMIRQKTWGPLRSVHAQVLTGRGGAAWERFMAEREGGGVLFHDGTHMVDILSFLLGPPLAVLGVSVAWGRRVEHSLRALLRYRGRVEVFLEVGGEREHFAFSLRLEFSRATLTVGNGLHRLELSQPSPRFSGFRELAPVPFPHEELRAYPNHGYAGPWFSLVNALQEEQTGCPCRPGSSWRDAVGGVRVMNQLLERAGGKRYQAWATKPKIR